MSQAMQFWLEPFGHGADTEQGLRARVADPLWFLARQWRLGELEGEDASSPVGVRVKVSHRPLRYDPRRPGLDPTRYPAEALVEAEPGDWWTLGRRIRLGRQAAPLLSGLSDDRLTALRFGELPAPYEAFAGAIDGRAVFTAHLLPGDSLWADVPSPAADRWSSRALCYGATFAAGRQRFAVRDHDGGDLDWYSADAVAPSPVSLGAEPAMTEQTVVPARLSYPGAPHPRWWQIEEHDVDIGGFAPDRSHLGTMLLFDVALAHADDWFWIPIPTPQQSDDADEPPPSSGVIATVHEAIVRDSFDDLWPLAPPSDWSLFKTAGLDDTALLIWPVAVAPQAGPMLDEVMLGVDEDANLAWAVELKAEGRTLLAGADTLAAIAETSRTGTRNFRYIPSTTLPPHWHPYRREEGDGRFGRWVQGIVADLGQVPPRPRPGPQSRLIGGPSGLGAGRGHVVGGHAIPSSGLTLRRRAMLARDVSGRPVLWVERSARPLLGPPVSHLRFDVLAEDAEPGEES
jgi:hypothetical protein